MWSYAVSKLSQIITYCTGFKRLNLNIVFVSMYRYCKVKVKEALLGDLLPGPVTLVFERSEVLNTDLNPYTSVSLLLLTGYY